MLVNQKIELLRKTRNMTMMELAEKTGTTQPTISKYENGQVRYIEPQKLEKIASALGVTTAELIAEDPRYTEDNEKKRVNRSKEEMVTIQTDLDKALLFSFHKMSEDTQNTVVHLCEIIASTSIA